MCCVISIVTKCHSMAKNFHVLLYVTNCRFLLLNCFPSYIFSSPTPQLYSTESGGNSEISCPDRNNQQLGNKRRRCNGRDCKSKIYLWGQYFRSVVWNVLPDLTVFTSLRFVIPMNIFLQIFNIRVLHIFVIFPQVLRNSWNSWISHSNLATKFPQLNACKSNYTS